MTDELIPFVEAEEVPVVRDDEARLNLTWNGQNGDLPDNIIFDATDAEIRAWAAEAIQAGSVPGINADRNADFSDFVVERYQSTDDRPWNVVMLRPKVPFGY